MDWFNWPSFLIGIVVGILIMGGFFIYIDSDWF